VHSTSGINYYFGKSNTNTLKFTYSDSNYRDVLDTSGFSAAKGVVYFICYVADKTNKSVSFYVNGTLKSKINDVNNLNYTARPGPARISSNLGGGEALNGSILDMALYNKTLSAQQIMSLYIKGRNTIVSQELNNTQVWACLVTPFSTSAVGSTYTSNSLTITNQDITYASLYNFTDNNQTLLNSGLGNFYVNANTTNTTIILEINNINITAVNVSNRYYANYTFTSGGIYTYKWWSYGSGSSKLINVSQTFNYAISTNCTIYGNITLIGDVTCNVFKGIKESRISTNFIIYKNITVLENNVAIFCTNSTRKNCLQ
jgi:hypothetical protein